MNRKIPPVIKEAVNFDLRLKPYELFYLDNGVPVYVINAGAQDVLQLELIFYAGNNFEQQKGIAAATNYLLKNGTNKRTAFQINEDFEYYGAYCNRASHNEIAVISLHTLTKHLDKLLPVLNDMLTDATFPESELDIYKQNSKQKLTVNLKKCEFVAGRLIDACLFGESHPYGSFNNLGDYDALTTDQLKSFYNQYYVNGSCAIFVAGKTPKELKPLLNDHFGKLTISKPTFERKDIKTSPATERKITIENDPGAVQGAIRIASNFPNRHHPDFKKVMVLNTVLGGFFGSRLMSNIREEKGYTYGIYSYLQNHIQQSAWVISTEAGKEVCNATIEEIYKEMNRLREEEINNAELSLVRNYMIGGILGDLDGPFHIIAKWKNIILNNLDESYFNDSVNEIKSISAGELKELANKYLDPSKFYELVVY
jgi:zinc protease